MKEWKKAVVHPSASVRDVMGAIDASGSQITIVIGENGRLLGTVTDGDIRRGILRGIELDAPATAVMNRSPTTIAEGEPADRIRTLMRTRRLRQIPIVDANDRVTGLATLEELTQAPERDNAVVLMAGGLGTRLLPLTANMPKPMLPIGDRPILEHAIVGLAEQGFRRFYLSINYLGDMVEGHFGDGSRWGVSIDYVRETQRMGTAGALSLLPERPSKPFIVMNGDIMTKLSFNQLMEAHEQSGAVATVCVRSHDYQVPFGVTRFENERLIAIEEKPTFRHFVSAGIYIVAPQVLDVIPSDCFFDMPQLLNCLLASSDPVHVFPITEYWLDIGRPDDLRRAVGDFEGDAR